MFLLGNNLCLHPLCVADGERVDQRSVVGVSQRSAKGLWAFPLARGRALHSYYTGISHMGRYPFQSLTRKL